MYGIDRGVCASRITAGSGTKGTKESKAPAAAIVPMSSQRKKQRRAPAPIARMRRQAGQGQDITAWYRGPAHFSLLREPFSAEA